MNPVSLTTPIRVIGLFLSLLLLTSCDTSQDAAQPRVSANDLQSATLIPSPKSLAPFALHDQHGAPMTPETMAGRWHLLSFGYTHCPDVCPTTLQFLKQLKQRLAEQGAADLYQTLFVSIDPDRDTAEVLTHYLASFDPAFIGITGTSDELTKLTGQLGVLAQRAESASAPTDYLMDHSNTLVLIDPQVRFQAILSPPHHMQATVSDLLKIIQP